MSGSIYIWSRGFAGGFGETLVVLLRKLTYGTLYNALHLIGLYQLIPKIIEGATNLRFKATFGKINKIVYLIEVFRKDLALQFH